MHRGGGQRGGECINALLNRPFCFVARREGRGEYQCSVGEEGVDDYKSKGRRDLTTPSPLSPLTIAGKGTNLKHGKRRKEVTKRKVRIEDVSILSCLYIIGGQGTSVKPGMKS